MQHVLSIAPLEWRIQLERLVLDERAAGQTEPAKTPSTPPADLAAREDAREEKKALRAERRARRQPVVDRIQEGLGWGSFRLWDRKAGVVQGTTARYYSGKINLEPDTKSALEGAVRVERHRIGADRERSPGFFPFDGLPE
jgi:hypothetical protein